jgi:hypothetical protein
MTARRFANAFPFVVMPGLDPGIHSVALMVLSTATEWIAGSSAAMTTGEGRQVQP